MYWNRVCDQKLYKYSTWNKCTNIVATVQIWYSLHQRMSINVISHAHRLFSLVCRLETWWMLLLCQMQEGITAYATTQLHFTWSVSIQPAECKTSSRLISIDDMTSELHAAVSFPCGQHPCGQHRNVKLNIRGMCMWSSISVRPFVISPQQKTHADVQIT